MTRLARGDAAMGAGIVATNGAAIGARLRQLQAVLDAWLVLIDGDDRGAIDARAIEERLEAARRTVADEPDGAPRG